MIRKISIENPITAKEQEVMMDMEREEGEERMGEEFGTGSLPVLALEGWRR